MAKRSSKRRAAARPRATGSRRAPVQRHARKPKFRPSAPARWKWLRAFQRAPLGAQAILAAVAALTLSVTVNWVYQVIRKPSELFFPVSGTLYKTPAETWAEYAPIFEEHSTATLTPEFLAALAQVEGSGNPIVRTYWRFAWKARPFEVYRPASSAVGMYQITDGTFREAKRYCIHDHRVATVGPWNDRHSCWFNSLYVRVIPSHAVELTAAYLEVRVAAILSRNRLSGASLLQKQHLATIIHLCGAGAGNAYARRGFRLRPGERCGDHSASAYLARVDAMRGAFARLAARD